MAAERGRILGPDDALQMGAWHDIERPIGNTARVQVNAHREQLLKY
jgi:hypothetical protein